MVFCTLYCPNKHKSGSQKNDDIKSIDTLLHFLKQSLKTNFCLVEDFNAWHIDWNCKTTNDRDTLLKQILRNRKCEFAYPNDFTRHGISPVSGNHVYSTLDLFLTNKLNHVQSCKTCTAISELNHASN